MDMTPVWRGHRARGKTRAGGAIEGARTSNLVSIARATTGGFHPSPRSVAVASPLPQRRAQCRAAAFLLEQSNASPTPTRGRVKRPQIRFQK